MHGLTRTPRRARPPLLRLRRSGDLLDYTNGVLVDDELAAALVAYAKEVEPSNAAWAVAPRLLLAALAAAATLLGSL